MPDQDQRFHELLGLLLDDETTPDQVRELTALVSANASFSRELRSHLAMDNRLHQHENRSSSADSFVRSVQSTVAAEEDAEAFVDKVIHLADLEQPDTAVSRAPWIITTLAMAACLTLVFFLVDRPTIHETAVEAPEPEDRGVAVVSGIVGEISFHGTALVNGDVVEPGLLEFAAGYLELEFYRGARMTVGGPARLEFVDSQNVICHFGKVRAQVPAVAKGFTVMTPESQVVDLGTEFAVSVGPAGETEIHVFDGEVEAYDVDRTPASKKLLTAGQAMTVANLREFPAEAGRFKDLVDIAGKERSARNRKFQKWSKRSGEARADERLIAYYDFEPADDQQRMLPNRAVSGSELDGAIVGATWSDGPWPGKHALNFKRPGDRVRISIPGEYEALTLAAWVRVDGIDRGHSSLLLTDGYETGEVHWQFRKDGTLVTGLKHGDRRGQNYVANGFVNLKRLGRWFHLATVVDPVSGTVTHFQNGKVLTVTAMTANHPFRFGAASIGNWDRPISGTGSGIRNLNGQLAELMIFKAALSAAEIRRLALK
jgi:hypothetical protein